ncbi:MAG: RnfH family protein [Candidatus Competibacter sp.]|nr:RnfH family protein [Candidatus Competibacter sp.]
MKVSIVYATPGRQFWMPLDLPEGSRVRDLIERSGVLNRFPEIDLERQKIGIFSKLTTLDAVLEDGDRVEIYRPITADPKLLKQKSKAAAAKSAGEAPPDSTA